MPDEDGYAGDVQYEVWRAGGNPDAIDPLTIQDFRAAGYTAEEAAGCVLSDARRRIEAQWEEPSDA